MTTRSSALVAVLALASLAACGKTDEAGSTPAAAPTADGVPAPRSKPDGAAWDALSWVRASDASSAEASIVDPRAARADAMAGRAAFDDDMVVDGRRWLVRRLGFPEDAASLLVVLREREEGQGRVVRLRAAKVGISLDDVRKAAIAHGGVESVIAGHPAWSFSSSLDSFSMAWGDGWLLRASGEGARTEIERAFAARGGKGGLRSLDGLAAAVATLPDTIPFQVEWGPKFGEFGEGVVPPSGVAIAVSPGDADTAVSALIFATEADRAAAHPKLEASLAAARKAGRLSATGHFADRGRILVLAMSDPKDASAKVRRAHNDLGKLDATLRARAVNEAEHRFPTTAEGLASLAKTPEALDDFLGVLPKDPWGHPYHYAFPHPTKPDEFDLRSAGPDGELDTEDDVFVDR